MHGGHSFNSSFLFMLIMVHDVVDAAQTCPVDIKQLVYLIKNNRKEKGHFLIKLLIFIFFKSENMKYL